MREAQDLSAVVRCHLGFGLGILPDIRYRKWNVVILIECGLMENMPSYSKSSRQAIPEGHESREFSSTQRFLGCRKCNG
jgi:hypothetical protein